MCREVSKHVEYCHTRKTIVGRVETRQVMYTFSYDCVCRQSILTRIGSLQGISRGVLRRFGPLLVCISMDIISGGP